MQNIAHLSRTSLASSSIHASLSAAGQQKHTSSKRSAGSANPPLIAAALTSIVASSEQEHPGIKKVQKKMIQTIL
jgi:hypothetical protein